MLTTDVFELVQQFSMPQKLP